MTPPHRLDPTAAPRGGRVLRVVSRKFLCSALDRDGLARFTYPMNTTSTAAAPFATITARLGIRQATTQHATQRAAEMAARKAIKSGAADSAAVWTATEQVNLFGRGK